MRVRRHHARDRHGNGVRAVHLDAACGRERARARDRVQCNRAADRDRRNAVPYMLPQPLIAIDFVPSVLCAMPVTVFV